MIRRYHPSQKKIERVVSNPNSSSTSEVQNQSKGAKTLLAYKPDLLTTSRELSISTWLREPTFTSIITFHLYTWNPNPQYQFQIKHSLVIITKP
jgi:hypothetical protein